jgi:hypothetical protein
MTTATGAIGVTLALIVGGLCYIAVLRYTKGAHRDRRYQAIPLLRMLVPPITYDAVDSRRSFVIRVAGGVLASLVSWITAAFVIHWMERAGEPAHPAAALVPAALMFIVVAIACHALAGKVETRESEGLVDASVPRPPHRMVNRRVMDAWMVLVGASVVCFLASEVHMIMAARSIDTAFSVSRFVGGGIVSPASASLCLLGGVLTALLATLGRLSLVGVGYSALADRSPAFRLLAGAPQTRPGSVLSTRHTFRNKRNLDLRYFAALLDLPMQNLGRSYLIGISTLILASAWSVGWVTTVDGVWFSRFITLSSWAVLTAALLLAAQAVATWNALETKLARLGRTPIDRAFTLVGRFVRWDLSIRPPRLSDLLPLASRAERLRFRLLAIANLHARDGLTQRFVNRRAPRHVELLNDGNAAAAELRPDDLTELTTVLNGHSPVDRLRDEIVRYKTAPLLQSRSWLELWGISDHLVHLLERVHWQRCEAPESLPSIADSSQPARRSGERVERPTAIERWFGECEEYVALQYAFVLRDVLARIMSSLFGAMLCVTFVTTAHLFYLFQGRSSLLTVDLIVLSLTAAVAIRVLVGMERDSVLSKLRQTTPGRIDFNWEFVRRVAIYGALPLVAVIASLFPEIGGSLFSWLEPLRKLAAP